MGYTLLLQYRGPHQLCQFVSNISTKISNISTLVHTLYSHYIITFANFFYWTHGIPFPLLGKYLGALLVL